MSQVNFIPLIPQEKYRQIQERPNELSKYKESISILSEEAQNIYLSSTHDAIESAGITSYWSGDYKNAYHQLKISIKASEDKKEFVERAILQKLLVREKS